MRRKKIKPRGSRRWVKKFSLAREVHFIQRRAAERDGRFVTAGELAFFSCETGDAWVLDPSDRFAAQIARDGDPEPFEFQETDTPSPLAGKVTTISMGALSSTPIKRRVAWLPSSATRLPKLPNWVSQRSQDLWL